MTEQEMLKMKVGETDRSGVYEIQRVPGGWLYIIWDYEADVPIREYYVPEKGGNNA